MRTGFYSVCASLSPVLVPDKLNEPAKCDLLHAVTSYFPVVGCEAE